MLDLGSAVGYLLLDTSGFEGGMKSAMSGFKSFSDKSKSMEDRFAGLGKGLTTLGTGMTKSLTLPLIGFGTAAGALSLKFEDVMAKVSTIADTTQVPLDDLKSAIMDLSDETGIAAQDIASNVYDAISAGQQTGDAVEFVGQAAKLATAGFTSSASSLDVLTTALNAYGLESEQASHVSDVLITTQNLGKTTVDELSQSIGKLIPVANANGASIEQLGASYAILTANGIATAESSTYLKGLFNELGKSGTKVSDILKKKTGKSFRELMDGGKSLGDVIEILSDYAEDAGVGLGDLFGSVEAGSAALTIASKGAEEYNSILDQMTNSAGATESAYEKMQTTTWTVKRAFNELKNVLTELGDALMQTLGPMISSLVDRIASFSKWFRGLSDGVKKAIVTVGMVVAALGPLLLIFGKLAGAISAISGLISGAGGLSAVLAALTGPIGIAVAAVAALATAWATNFGGIRDKTAEVMKSIGSVISSVLSFITGLWENNFLGIQDIVAQAFALIEGIFSDALDLIVGIFEAFSLLFQGKWDEAFERVVSALGNFVSDFMRRIGEFVDLVVDTIIRLGVRLYHGAKDAFVKFVDGAKQVWHNFVSWLEWAVNNPVDVIRSIGSALYSAGASIFTSLWDGMKSIWDGVVSWVSSGIDWLASKVRFWESESAKISSRSGNSHAAGLDYVPYDGYPAILHRGERVLTQQEVREGVGAGLGGRKVTIEVPVVLNGRQIAKATVKDIDKELGKLR